jgi:NADH:ubiquinone oxidoreductase subunit 2 (subunit N)
LALSIMRDKSPSLSLSDVRGFARTLPFAAAGLILANLALAGMPLLAGFPVHQAVWEEVARDSLPLSFWVFLGSFSLATSAIRVLGALVSMPEGTPWIALEKRSQRFFMITGSVALFLLGLFPQWALPLWSKLPVLFEHLGQ